MGDEHVGEAVILLKVFEQVYYLALYGYVEGGNRLVTDDELRFNGKGSRYADSLTLSAGKLVREPVGVLPVKTYGLKKLVYPFLSLLPVVHVVNLHTFRDYAAYQHSRIQGGIRILEYYLGFSRVFHLVFRSSEVELFAFKGYGTLCRLVYSHNDSSQRGLSAAGLSYNSESLALIYVQGNIVYGNQGLPLSHVEMLGHVI